MNGLRYIFGEMMGAKIHLARNKSLGPVTDGIGVWKPSRAGRRD